MELLIQMSRSSRFSGINVIYFAAKINWGGKADKLTKFQWKETKCMPILSWHKRAQSFVEKGQYVNVTLEWIVIIICLLTPVQTRQDWGIWKRRFQSENASHVFCPHNAGGIFKHILTMHRRSPFFGFVFEKNSVREITRISPAPFSKWFSSTRKQKSRHFQILSDWIAFRKALFSWGISGVQCGNEAAFSNSSSSVV